MSNPIKPVNFYAACLADKPPSRVFLESPSGQIYSYGELDSESAKIANYLYSIGLKQGDRVAVQVEKSAQNLFWYFACLRSGIIYLPLNTAYQAIELEHFINNAAPSLVLCDPAKLSTFEQLTNCRIETLDSNGNTAPAITAAVQQNSDSFATATTLPNDVAVILYTSGTTGKPKGAMISHGNLLSNTLALSDTWQWQSDDVMLHALPIFHIHGLFVATHLSVFNGSKIIFLDKFSPQVVCKNLARSTVYMGVPTNYVRLIDSGLLSTEHCKNMRLFTSGSAPLLEATFKQFQNLTGHHIVERYGMTETGMNTSNPIDGPRKPGTVGLPLAGTEVKILDQKDQLAGIDQAGDLYVKGDNVFQGYWQMPEKTAEEFDEQGFFKTGDLAKQDKDGYISIIGRNKDMIISGGLNIYPVELEAFIDKLPGVLESAVIGLPDSDFGEAVCAVVVLSSSQSSEQTATLAEADITAAMKASLAGFKVAKQVYFVDELPRNTMGKVQKNQLRQDYQS